MRIDESGGYTIRCRVVVPFAHMHPKDIAGNVGSSCEVRPWLKASVADTDYSILDKWSKTILAQACEAKAKLIRLSWRWRSDAISSRMSSGRRRSGGSDSALPQSEL